MKILKIFCSALNVPPPIDHDHFSRTLTLIFLSIYLNFGSFDEVHSEISKHLAKKYSTKQEFDSPSSPEQLKLNLWHIWTLQLHRFRYISIESKFIIMQRNQIIWLNFVKHINIDNTKYSPIFYGYMIHFMLHNARVKLSQPINTF